MASSHATEQPQRRVRSGEWHAVALSFTYFFCVLAAGQVDLALDAHMEPYDIAPLIPIIEGAGGIVTTWERGPAAKGGNVIAAKVLSCREPAAAPAPNDIISRAHAERLVRDRA